MATMQLRPHHTIDIISSCGHGAELKPHPYGHAVHTVAKAILSDIDMQVELIVGADDICRPCKHLKPDGQCDDVLSQLDPPMSKQEYNDDLDLRLFAQFGLEPGTVMSIRQFLEIVDAHVPGAEGEPFATP